MSRIETRFRQLREQRRKALIPYVTGGDPRPDVTVPLLHALVGKQALEQGLHREAPVVRDPGWHGFAHGLGKGRKPS